MVTAVRHPARGVAGAVTARRRTTCVSGRDRASLPVMRMLSILTVGGGRDDAAGAAMVVSARERARVLARGAAKRLQLSRDTPARSTRAWRARPRESFQEDVAQRGLLSKSVVLSATRAARTSSVCPSSLVEHVPFSKHSYFSATHVDASPAQHAPLSTSLLQHSVDQTQRTRRQAQCRRRRTTKSRRGSTQETSSESARPRRPRTRLRAPPPRAPWPRTRPSSRPPSVRPRRKITHVRRAAGATPRPTPNPNK